MDQQKKERKYEMIARALEKPGKDRTYEEWRLLQYAFPAGCASCYRRIVVLPEHERKGRVDG